MRLTRRFNPFVRQVTVQIKGPDLEEFINLCVSRGVRLWDAERPGSRMLIVRMDPESFKRLRSFDQRSKWEVRIVERHGGGFLIANLLRRRSFLLGGIGAAIVWYVLSMYVWFVAVEGMERVDRELILALASEAGVAPGTLLSTIDSDHVQRTLLLGLDDLVWAGIELRGTHAVIKVAERRVPDEVSQGPGHVVAIRDGVIERVSVLAGSAVVGPGDTVRAGQILISGLLEPGSDEFLQKTGQGELPYIRAAGSVHAVVWHESTAEVVTQNIGVAAAREQAIGIAVALAQDWVESTNAEPTGEPVIEVEESPETGTVHVRVLIQAVQEIGGFQAVVP